MKSHVWDSDMSLGRNLCRGVREWMRNVAKNQEFWAAKRLTFLIVPTRPYCECVSECSSHGE